MSIACVIPARFASTRFPGKLLAKIQGKTVLQRTFEQAKKARCFDSLYVATDDERIASHMEELGADVVWTSSLCPNGTERIREAFFKEPRLQKASIVVNVQGDHPCICEKTIEKVVSALQNHPEALVATAISPLSDWEAFLSPHVVKCVFDEAGRALYFSRAPIPYAHSPASFQAWGHIGIYAYRPEFFHEAPGEKTTLQMQEDLEQLRVLEKGKQIQTVLVEEIPLGVDVPGDLVQLERSLCQNTSL